MNRAPVLVAVALVAGLAGCNKKKTCSLMFKGQVFYQVGPDWAYPDEVCGLIAKAISESSEGTLVDMFGMGASSWKEHPQHCVCE